MSDGFAFYVHKPKARKIADLMHKGARQRGVPFRVLEPHQSTTAGEIAIFYGVVPDTWRPWKRALEQKRALYLDNGFLNGFRETTLRFTWNGVQAVPEALQEAPGHWTAFWDGRCHERGSQRLWRASRALLCLQSEKYFQNVGIRRPTATWASAVEQLLKSKGYDVLIRPKPTKERPHPIPLSTQINQTGIVVSANSAVCLKAAIQGVPSYCLMPSTLTPICPRVVPSLGAATAASKAAVHHMVTRLASQELTYEDLRSGAAIDRILTIPHPKRVGINYDTH